MLRRSTALSGSSPLSGACSTSSSTPSSSCTRMPVASSVVSGRAEEAEGFALSAPAASSTVKETSSGPSTWSTWKRSSSIGSEAMCASSPCVSTSRSRSRPQPGSAASSALVTSASPRPASMSRRRPDGVCTSVASPSPRPMYQTCRRPSGRPLSAAAPSQRGITTAAVSATARRAGTRVPFSSFRQS